MSVRKRIRALPRNLLLFFEGEMDNSASGVDARNTSHVQNRRRNDQATLLPRQNPRQFALEMNTFLTLLHVDSIEKDFEWQFCRAATQ